MEPTLWDEGSWRIRNKNPRENNLEEVPIVRTFNHLQIKVLNKATSLTETTGCTERLGREKDESSNCIGLLAVPQNAKCTPTLEYFLCSDALPLDALLAHSFSHLALFSKI